MKTPLARGSSTTLGRDASAAVTGILTSIGREIMARQPPRPVPVAARSFGAYGRAEFETVAGFASVTWQLGAGGEGFEVTAAVDLGESSAGAKVWLNLADGVRSRPASYERNPITGELGGPVTLATRSGAGLLLSIYTDSTDDVFGDVLFTSKSIPARI